MKKFLVVLTISLISIVGALLMLDLFGNTEFNIDALQAELKVDLKQPGSTEIYIPPLGKIKAKTHSSPVGIKLTLQSIDLNQLEKMVDETPKTNELLQEVHDHIRDKFIVLIYKSLILGFCGGLLAVLLLQRRRWYEYLYGGLLGLLAVALVLSVTYKSYNLDGFQNPEYEGMLKTAPWMISLVQEGISKFDLWSKQLQTVADNLYDMFQRVDSLQAMGSAGNGDLRVLHVSDLHNNPAAIDFMKQVSNTFQVDFIIDTGDISDFGTPLESVLVEKLASLQVPYVFIPGNHETPEIISSLKGISNVTVLEKNFVSLKGLQIAGWPDPAAYGSSVESLRGKEADLMAAEIKEQLANMQQPDILAVHNHRVAGKLAGEAPVILNGHDHGYKITVKDNSVIINAGTTGASGIGGLKSRKDIPYSMVLLQFKNSEAGYQLIAADTIKVSNLQSGYSLERRMFPELFPPGVNREETATE